MNVFKSKINELEIPEEESNRLLIELMKGATEYFQKNHGKKDIDELIRNITSKGGTTEAGLNYFKENDLSPLFGNVIIATQKRSKEINETK